MTSRQPRTSDWLKSRKELDREILGRVSWACSAQIVKYSISNSKFDSQNLENVTYLVCVAEGREEVIRRVSEVMHEREGDCGRKKRINNLSNSGHKIKIIKKKVPNEIEFGLEKCNKVWLKIYKKKNEMCNEPGRLSFNLNGVKSAGEKRLDLCSNSVHQPFYTSRKALV